MKEKLTFLTLLLAHCVFVGVNTFAQDVRFSQTFSNPLFLNPAYAGSLGCSRIAVNYRNLWSSMTNDFFLFSSSYDQYVDKLKGGVGLQFFSENLPAGKNSTNSINGFYAYNLSINDNLHFRPAFNIGMGIKQVDWGKFGYLPYVDSTSSKNYLNVGTGLLVVYKKLITGISIDHINTPVIGYGTYKLPVKLGIHCSYPFDIKEKTHLTPSVFFRKQQEFEEIVLNILLQIKYIKLGFGFSQSFYTSNYLMGTVGFCNNWMSIGYSYDVALSKLSGFLYASHEISTVFKVSCKNDKEDFKITPLCGF